MINNNKLCNLIKFLTIYVCIFIYLNKIKLINIILLYIYHFRYYSINKYILNLVVVVDLLYSYIKNIGFYFCFYF